MLALSHSSTEPTGTTRSSMTPRLEDGSKAVDAGFRGLGRDELDRITHPRLAHCGREREAPEYVLYEANRLLVIEVGASDVRRGRSRQPVCTDRELGCDETSDRRISFQCALVAPAETREDAANGALHLGHRDVSANLGASLDHFHDEQLPRLGRRGGRRGGNRRRRRGARCFRHGDALRRRTADPRGPGRRRLGGVRSRRRRTARTEDDERAADESNAGAEAGATTTGIHQHAPTIPSALAHHPAAPSAPTFVSARGRRSPEPSTEGTTVARSSSTRDRQP
jgi:hypothetical protein